MWMAGGMNQTDAFGFDQVWQLDMTGVIAAGSVAASAAWSKIPTSASDKDASRYGLAGTVLPPVGNVSSSWRYCSLASDLTRRSIFMQTDRKGTLVVFGGCDPNAAGMYNASCAQNAANILTLPTDSSQTAAQWTTAARCLPGSYGATMAPNRNLAASIFSSQAFLFPGSVDQTEWTDNSGTQQGEVAILLASSGVWARVLPAGDPSSDPPRPSFKEGSTVYSHSGSITGNSGAWSDTVVFGGRNIVTGELTNELWLLRAYNGSIQSSGDHWSGYGDGNLGTGLAAAGSGVTVQYLSQCATFTSHSNSGSTTGDGANPTPTPTPSPSGQTHYSESVLDGSPVHKIFSPVSIALLLPAILLYRASTGPLVQPMASSASIAFASSGGIVATTAYVLGIVGFALGVARSNNDSPATTLRRRAESVTTHVPFLSTAHSRAALVLFVVLYGILPLLAAALYMTKPRDPKDPTRPELEHNRKTTDETVTKTLVGTGPGEKGTARSSDDELGRRSRRSVDSQAVGETEEGLEMTPRPQSGIFSTFNSATAKSRRKSTATLQSSSPPSAYTPTKFEVVNRPNRSSVVSNGHAYSHLPRNPSELSWIERRRSVGVYGQLDFQLSQNGRSPPTFPPPPSSAHEMSPTTPQVPALTPPRLPSRPAQLWFNVALQVIILWAVVFWLVTFAIMGSMPRLIVSALMAVVYYVMLVILAWLNRPQHSILVVVIGRLRGDPADLAPVPPSEAPSTPIPPISSPPHPYLTSPRWRATQSHASDDLLSRARSMDSEVPDDDEDDDERQARIEEEMARRDVSIFTVPKRRLVVRNVALD